MLKKLFIAVLLLVLAAAALGVYHTFTPPRQLYSSTGQFAGCPRRPSCVSSLADDDQHRVVALGYTGDLAANFVMLKEVVERMGGKIDQDKDGYLHAVFISPLLGLPLRDDLELLMLPSGRVDVRSISRFAYNDSGTNRARVEQLRRAFEAMPQQ